MASGKQLECSVKATPVGCKFIQKVNATLPPEKAQPVRSPGDKFCQKVSVVAVVIAPHKVPGEGSLEVLITENRKRYSKQYPNCTGAVAFPGGKADAEEFEELTPEQKKRLREVSPRIAQKMPHVWIEPGEMEDLGAKLVLAAIREAGEEGLGEKNIPVDQRFFFKAVVGEECQVYVISREQLGTPERDLRFMTPFLILDFRKYKGSMPNPCGQGNNDSQQAGWVSLKELCKTNREWIEFCGNKEQTNLEHLLEFNSNRRIAEFLQKREQGGGIFSFFRALQSMILKKALLQTGSITL